MKICHSCLWSIAHWEHEKPVLYCCPQADASKEKKAEGICEDYQQAVGNDEPEEVKR